MERIGLGFLGEPSPREAARLASLAERAGFESVWVAETRFMRDAITMMSAIACSTSEVRIASAAINPFTRGAVLTAVTFASLDELSGGRAILGIGAGSEHVLTAQGYAFERPIRRLGEWVGAIRAVWHGRPFEGQFVCVDGVALDFDPHRPEIPIYLAVTGPRALALAGRIADGVILDVFTSPEHTRSAVEQIRAAAVSAGRDPKDIEITGALAIALDTEEMSGRDVLAPRVALYLTQFPTIAIEAGLTPYEISEYQAIAERDGVAALAKRLPPAVLDSVTVTGTPEQCRARIAEYRSAGLDVPILMPPTDQFERVITELAPR